MKIEITEQQLQLISRALDFYSRVGAGQFKVITEHPTFEKSVYRMHAPKRLPVVGDRTAQGEVLEIKNGKALIDGSVRDGLWCKDKEWKKLEDVELSADWSKVHNTVDNASDVLNIARNMLTGLTTSRNGNWGIHNENVDESCRVAFDLHQDIRHYFWKLNEKRSNITVDSSVHYTSAEFEPLNLKL